MMYSCKKKTVDWIRDIEIVPKSTTQNKGKRVSRNYVAIDKGFIAQSFSLSSSICLSLTEILQKEM